MTMDSSPQETGRRRRRAAERGGGAVSAQPPGQPELPFAPVELVSRDELESIHQAALTVLREIGIDFLHDEALEREPSLFTVINSSSPLRLDTPMVDGIIQMARRNQVVVMTPFTLAGA